MQADIWELKILRIYDLNVVPRRFFEQARDLKGWNLDRLYSYSSSICSNPCNLIYALHDEGRVIRGILWARIDILSEELFVVLLSVDKEYQGANGAAIDAAKLALEEVKRTAGLKRITFLTTRPKAYEKHGMKRTKAVIMEV